MMEWMNDGFSIVLVVAFTVLVLITAVYKFLKSPSAVQKQKVNEWLIWACIEAEKALQSGTGQLKLRKVYDAFIAVPAFSWIAKIISFETFSSWVSIALEKAKTMIVNNPDLANYVYGENALEEVAKLKAQLGL